MCAEFVKKEKGVEFPNARGTSDLYRLELSLSFSLLFFLFFLLSFCFVFCLFVLQIFNKSPIIHPMSTCLSNSFLAL